MAVWQIGQVAPVAASSGGVAGRGSPAGYSGGAGGAGAVTACSGCTTSISTLHRGQRNVFPADCSGSRTFAPQEHVWIALIPSRPRPPQGCPHATPARPGQGPPAFGGPVSPRPGT